MERGDDINIEISNNTIVIELYNQQDNLFCQINSIPLYWVLIDVTILKICLKKWTLNHIPSFKTKLFGPEGWGFKTEICP